MHKEPILIFANPNDEFFIWQCHLYIESCIRAGFKIENIHPLIYVPPGRESLNQKWQKLMDVYEGLKIYFYNDKGAAKHLGVYIPVLRPHVIAQHFEAFPELDKEVIIYTDCDILWTRKPDIEKFYDDDTSYISDAKSYMNADYFESKKNDVKAEKKEEYLKRDILKETCNLIGVSVNYPKLNNNNTGGVQYILKGTNVEFWKKVEKDVISIRTYLMDINRQFFESESKGIQSWCADLWAVLWNLWYFKKRVKVVKELNFAWATDSLEKLETVDIYHNAGVVSPNNGGINWFYKGKYHQGGDPTEDPHLQTVLNDPESRKRCTWYYASKLQELKIKYNLKY